MCVLLLGAAGLTRVFVLMEERQTTLAAAEQATRDWAVLLEQYTARTFETGDLLSDMIIDDVRQRGGVDFFRSDQQLHRILLSLVGRSPADYLMVVNRHGRPVALTAAAIPPDVDLSDREWFRTHAVDGKEIVIGPSIFSRITSEVLFTFSRRITLRDGSFDGALQVSLRPSFFETVRLDQSLGPAATFALWTPQGRLIGRSRMTREQADQGFVSPALAKHIPTAPTGTFIAASAVDGTERIISYRTLSRWGVVVTASIPKEDGLAQWRMRVQESVYFFFLLVVVASAAGAWAFVSASRLEDTASSLSVALGQKDNLLREMHHRVKNNLQMTMSLMRMAARRATSDQVKTLVAEMEERLRSMSLLFEMVYRSDLSGQLSLRAYVRQLVDAIEKSFGARESGIVIVVNCDDIRMDADRIGTVGLLITEVLTNAMKHAFSAQAHPRIEVTIVESGDAIDIVIADNGRGIEPGAGGGRSLGMSMISAFVQQLGGESSIASNGGTSFVARVPREADAPRRAPDAPHAGLAARSGASGRRAS